MRREGWVGGQGVDGERMKGVSLLYTGRDGCGERAATLPGTDRPLSHTRRRRPPRSDTAAGGCARRDPLRSHPPLKSSGLRLEALARSDGLNVRLFEPPRRCDTADADAADGVLSRWRRCFRCLQRGRLKRYSAKIDIWSKSSLTDLDTRHTGPSTSLTSAKARVEEDPARRLTNRY